MKFDVNINGLDIRADFSDMANVRLCLTHSKKADLTLVVGEEISS